MGVAAIHSGSSHRSEAQAVAELTRAIAPLASEPLGATPLHELGAVFRWRALGRGETLHRAGDQATTIELVVDGVLRLYYLRDDGREFTKGFVRPRLFHAAPYALLDAAPLCYTVEAVTPAVVLVGDYDSTMAIFDRDLTLQKCARRLFQHLAAAKQRREAALLMQSAAERYSGFLKEMREIEQQVPDAIIASYLGITPETLSRVKRERILSARRRV